MTNQTLQLTTESPEATERLGESIGAQLKGGEVIELVSDLGGGKTTLVRGLARGFGSTDKVASPTYTISKVYKHGSRELHHFDFYRLSEAGLVGHELAEVINDPNCVVVIEWGEVVQDALPEERLTIEITKSATDSRQFTITFPEKFRYLVEGLTA